MPIYATCGITIESQPYSYIGKVKLSKESDDLWPKKDNLNPSDTSKWQVVRGALTSYTGIFGLAFVVFAAREEFIDMADWARWLVNHWRDLTESFWGWLLKIVRFKLAPEYIPFLNSVVFVYAGLIGAKFYNTRLSRAYATILPRDSNWYIVFSLLFGVLNFLFLYVIIYNTEIKNSSFGIGTAYFIWLIPYFFVMVGTDGDRRILRNLQYRTFCIAIVLAVLFALNYISLLNLDLKNPPT